MAFSSSSVSIGHSTKKSDYNRLLDNTKALKDEAITFNGTKTFADTATFSSDVEMSGTILTGIKTDGIFLKTKVIPIGDWNMDATALVDIAHSLDWTKIRDVNVLIRNDANELYAKIEGIHATGTLRGATSVTSTNITIQRYNSGYFDSTAYDSTSFNRGWITILYES